MIRVNICEIFPASHIRYIVLNCGTWVLFIDPSDWALPCVFILFLTFPECGYLIQMSVIYSSGLIFCKGLTSITQYVLVSSSQINTSFVVPFNGVWMMNLHLYIRNIVLCPALLMSENCIYIIHQSMSIDILLYYLFSCKLYNSPSFHIRADL